MCDPTYVSRSTTAPVPRPRWGVLYGVIFLGLSALTIGDLMAPEVARPSLDGALAAAALVAISLWVRGNRAALDQQEWCECAADTMTVRVIPSRRSEPCHRWIPHVPEYVPAEPAVDGTERRATPRVAYAVDSADHGRDRDDRGHAARFTSSTSRLNS